MGIAFTPTEWVRRERRDNAQAIARQARVFVRQARTAGHTNLITELSIAEAAQVLGISGDAYALRTVKQIIKAECVRSGELHLIAPRWGR